ncbi:isocitrate/isopropylmalate dehydrogenase family protein, partial [bacterium]|nr:isocitrate/isopropylmalate dehydrogenase family protein [bacterium]
MFEDKINMAKEKFGKILESQLAGVERMKKAEDWVSYEELNPIVIGLCPGDGIGPAIFECAKKVLEHFLKEDLDKGRIKFKNIQGLTIENRAEHKKAIPDDVLKELKSCHVILKGP